MAKRKALALAAIVFGTIASLQFWLVARVGTDVPFDDQWDVEGKRLYPHFLVGTWRIGDLLKAHNEHRILWTQLLDLVLFGLNHAWDPLLQEVANVLLRSAAAAWLAILLVNQKKRSNRFIMVTAIILAYFPILAWHNVLWGFQTQVCFALFFGWLALWRAIGAVSLRHSLEAIIWGLAAQLAMGSGLLLSAGLAAIYVARSLSQRRIYSPGNNFLISIIVFLSASAWCLRATASASAALHPSSLVGWGWAFAKMLAWPHFDVPLAAVAISSPFFLYLFLRLHSAGILYNRDQLVIGLSGWSLALAAATAYSRGGSAEFAAGLPSRYVDFAVLWPLVNLWCALELFPAFLEKKVVPIRLLFAGWLVFAFIGWLGDSAVIWRGIIVPRMRDPAAPVRLAVAFQHSWDPAVFRGQPKLYIPHPNLEVVSQVLRDPRLAGRLPPSLQNDQEGPLSRVVRWSLHHAGYSIFALWLVLGAIVWRVWPGKSVGVLPAHKSEQ